jgi:hypothetical protein
MIINIQNTSRIKSAAIAERLVTVIEVLPIIITNHAALK